MKLKINKDTYLWITFLVTTLGNSSFLTTKELSNKVTYFGIAFLLLDILYKDYKYHIFCNNRGFKHLFIAVGVSFSIGLLVQSIGILLKIKLLMTMFFVASFALLSRELISDYRAVRYAARGIFDGTIVATILALIGGESISSLVVEGINGFSNGFNGGLQHKNYFACAMLVVILAHIICNKYEKRSIKNSFYIVISSVLLLLSKSRGAWIMMLVFLCVFYNDFLKKIKHAHRCFFVLLCSLFLAVTAIALYITLISNSGTYMIRIRGLLEYINLYKSDRKIMLFGNVAMAWKDGESYADNVRAALGWDGTVELSLLSILIKNGIAGVFGYILIFLYYIKIGMLSNNKIHRTIILASTLSLLSSAFVENYIANTHVIYGIYMYCLINGFVTREEKIRNKSKLYKSGKFLINKGAD